MAFIKLSGWFLMFPWRPVGILILFLVFPRPIHAAPVKTGAEVLADASFSPLRGKRFGLVTNRTATVGGIHLLDLMASAGIRPVVIFTPEHGLRGMAEDGVHLADDSVAGIPVRSLYGVTKKPRFEDLQGLDLVLFDIQDIGVRFYTYISTMGLVMQAAAEAKVPLMVLDRPNPLGGTYVSGFVRDELPASFTSLYPIPVAHGMTVGELALLIKGGALLPGLASLDLTVVRMEGWQRWMRWPDTELAWIPTSPNIPDFGAALLYAGICFLEGTVASEGRGTDEPFRLVGCPGVDGETLARNLNHLGLAGVRFEPVRFTPVSMPGKSTAPKFMHREVAGVRILVTDYSAVQPVETGVAVVSEIYWALSPLERKGFFRNGFDDLAGSVLLREETEAGDTPEEISRHWRSAVQRFQQLRGQYLIYSDR